MNGTAPSQGAGGGGGGGSWGGAGAGAGAVAGGGRPTLDQILFMGLGSSPQRMTVSLPIFYPQSGPDTISSHGPP